MSDFVLRFASSQIASVRIFVDASAGAPQIDAVQLLTGGTYSSDNVHIVAHNFFKAVSEQVECCC